MLMPWPTIATSRPPGSSRCNACSTCCAPSSGFLPTPGRDENGGFISTTVGRTSWSSVLSSLEASALVVRTPPKLSSAERRCGAISLAVISRAPAARAAATSEPVPADGSSTRSPGRMFAARATTPA
jgi:hypothetical protein